MKLDGYSLEEVLAWLNEQRAIFHIGPPLKAIPKGRRAVCNHCPIAEALSGCMIDGTNWWPPDAMRTTGFLKSKDAHPLPECVRLFILDFDSGDYPELEGEWDHVKGEIVAQGSI